MAGGGALWLRVVDRRLSITGLLLLGALNLEMSRVVLLGVHILVSSRPALLEMWVDISVAGMLREASRGDQIGMFAT